MISPLSSFSSLSIAALLAITIGCSQQAKLEDHLAQGNASFESGDYRTAEIEYKNVLQIDSNISEAIGNLGLIYHSQGRLLQAYPFLNHVRDIEPENLLYRGKLGTLLHQAGNTQEAWDEALFILEKAPTDKTALFLLQAASMNLKKMDEARFKIESIHASTPSAAANVALGMIDAIGSDFDAAEKRVQTAIELDPNLSEAHAAMGSLHWARGEQDAADAAYRRSFELAQGDSSRQFIYAQYKFRSGDADAANRLVDQILETAPRFVPALTLKAQLESAEANFEDATAISDEILQLTPYNPEAILLSSRLKLAQNQFEDAIRQLERAVERFPEIDALTYQLALAHLGNNEPIKSTANLTRTIVINPNHNEAILMQAALNARQGDPEAAIVSLQEVIIKNSKNIQAQTLLAQIHLESGHLDEALNLYQALGKQLENNPAPPQLEAEVLLRMNQSDLARDALTRSLKRNVNYLPSLVRITDLDIADRRFNDAVSRIDSLFAEAAEPAYLHMLKGKVMLASEDAAGEMELKRAIELKPTLRDAYLYLAVHYTISKKLDQAIAKLQAMVDLNSEDIEALMRIGGIYEQREDFASARSTYTKVVKANKDNSAALNNLAYINAEHFNKIDVAYDQAMRARDLRPTDPAIADTLGWVNFKRGDYTLALSLIKESATKISQHPEIQYHLAKAHAALKETVEAKAAFSKALELGLEGDKAAEAKQAIGQ